MYPSCASCGLHLHCKSPVITNGVAREDIKLIIINESPGVQEDNEGVQFTGPSARLLSKILGDKRDQVYFTNLVKCCPYVDPVTHQGGSRPPTPSEIEYCKTILSRELKLFNDNIPIMTLGNIALEGLVGPHAGITKELGKRRKLSIGNKTFDVIPNYHPTAVIKNNHLFTRFQQITDKAFSNEIEEEATTKFKLLNFEESIKEIHNIIDLYNKGTISWVVFDIETTSLMPWNGDVIMYSISHEASPHSFVIPVYINNDIKPDFIPEYQEIIKDKTKNLDSSLSESEIEKIIAPHLEPVRNMLIDKLTIPFNIDSTQKAKINAGIKLLCETVPLIGHNLKFDLRFLYVKLGLNLERVKVFADTLVMAHQVYGRTFGSSLSLKDLSRQAFDVSEDWEHEIKFYLSKYRLLKDRHYGNIPTGILYPYAGLDTFYTKKLYHILSGSLMPGMVNITEEVTRATVPYVELESKGVNVDSEMMSFLGNSYKGAMERIDSEVRDLPIVNKYINSKLPVLIDINSKKKKPKPIEELKKEAFSMSSIPMLRDVFYGKDYYNLPVLNDFKTPKGEPQTGADVIKEMIKYHAKDEALEFLKKLDDYKTYSKIVSTYIDGLPENIFEGSYKPDFSLTSTITGRLSSGFHVLPSKSDVKRIFTSRWKNEGGLFIAADQSQLELRVVASLSNELKMIEAFKQGVDAHTATGAVIYKKELSEVTDKERKVGKIVNFAILFGKVAYTLAPDIGCTVEEAQEILDGFFNGRPGLKKFIEGQHNYVMEYGFVETATGRIIPVPDAFSDDKGHINHAKRCSVNYVVQGPASDIVLTSGNEIYYAMKSKKMKSSFIGSVHDFLGYDTYPGELFEMVKLIKYHCEEGVAVKYPWATCPLVMDISIGSSWGGAIEFKIKEMTDDKLVLKGGALAKDFKLFKAVAEKAYNIELNIEERTEISQEKFAKDIFFKDREFWDCTVVLTKKQN